MNLNVKSSVTVPTVSVVVALLNARNTIAATIESIVSQQNVYFELLVVDGGSADGSWETVEKYANKIAWTVREPDSGIYHAWNKALQHAAGRYVCFLGADDRLAHPDALAKLADATQGTADLVSCRSLRTIDGGGAFKFGRQWDWNALAMGMCIEHRALLHKRELFQRVGTFDTSYRIAGDLDFLYRCGPNLKTAFVDEALVVAGEGGLSEKYVLRRLLERRRAQISNGVKQPNQATLEVWLDLMWHLRARTHARLKQVLHKLHLLPNQGS